MKTKHFRERGQALILITFAAIALFGITGLAIDGGNKYSDRRHAQNAADTAALAAALARANTLTNNPGMSDSEVCPNASPGSLCQAISDAALDRALDNGYDNNLVTNEVKVYTCNNPASSCGPYAGNKNYVQVIITSTVDTYFMRVLGIDQSQNTVQAVALAGKGGAIANGSSIVSMNPNPNCGNGSFNVGGNGEIHLTGGGMFVNSNVSCGYTCDSGSLILTTSPSGIGISSAGSTIDQHCGTGLPANETAPQIQIPDEVYMPERPAECDQTAAAPYHHPSGKWIIYPGYYTDFPQAGLIGNNQDIELAAGIYCVDSDIHWSGATFDSLDGSNGVTIYITPGHDFSLSINSPITLDASHLGTKYDGYLIILDGDPNVHPNCTINGGSYLDLNGTIFAPYCNITVNGDNSTQSEFNAQIIGWDVKLNGGNVMNITYDPADNGKIQRRVGLMK
jgi:Flp pilus assembly protein TadG